MNAVITGATGFVGRQLWSRLESATVLTRRPEKLPQALSLSPHFAWDPSTEPAPAEALEGCDAVFHLAGESVGEGRWTKEKKRRIRDSRVVGTRNLVAGLKTLGRPPSVLVSASAVGYYGSRGDEQLDEHAAPGDDFLADVCVEWESAAREASQLGIRVVCIRIGMVLGHGGALRKMLPIFKLGAGGTLGNGRQWMPWIHVDDLVGLLVFAAENLRVEGALNAVAPAVATNRDFTKALARAVSRPAIFPVPGFALRLAVGEFAAVLLASQRVVGAGAERHGFKFDYDDLDKALAEAVT